MKTWFVVTGGPGGDATLLVGKERAALIDSGLPHLAYRVAERVRSVIGDRPVDTLLLTHTHYDHVGVIPYRHQLYPQLEVAAAEHAVRVFSSENARKLIRELSEAAAQRQGMLPEFLKSDYRDENYTVQQVLQDGEGIPFGDFSVQALFTPGHTRCSMSFFIPEQGILFPSETTGVMPKMGFMIPQFLISYADAMTAIERCRNTGATTIVVPHGMVLTGKEDCDRYWVLAREACERCREEITRAYAQGKSEEEMVRAFIGLYRPDAKGTMDKAALINTVNTIRTVIREFCTPREEGKE